MKIFSWNCRGLGNASAVRALCELIKTHKPDVVFLFETLVCARRIEEIRIRIGFAACFAVDCVGRSGGIGAFWREPNSCCLQTYSSNHIDFCIEDLEARK